MSGSLGLSYNKSKANNAFRQNVWGPQGDALGDLYGQAGNLFGATTGGAAGQSDFGRQFSQNAMEKMNPAFDTQLQGGAYKDMNLQNNLTSSLSQSLNNPSAMQDINSMIMGGSGNNYADAMKNKYIADADQAGQTMLKNLDARASASGMSGGARQGVATRGGFDDINRNLQSNLAQTGFSAFDKDLDRKLAIAQQADQNTFGRQQLMSDMIGQQQGAMSGGLNYGGNMLNYGQQQQMMPWQQAGAYSNILGGPTVLGSGEGSSMGKGYGFSSSASYGGKGGGGGGG